MAWNRPISISQQPLLPSFAEVWPSRSLVNFTAASVPSSHLMNNGAGLDSISSQFDTPSPSRMEMGSDFPMRPMILNEARILQNAKDMEVVHTERQSQGQQTSPITGATVKPLQTNVHQPESPLNPVILQGGTKMSAAATKQNRRETVDRTNIVQQRLATTQAMQEEISEKEPIFSTDIQSSAFQQPQHNKLQEKSLLMTNCRVVMDGGGAVVPRNHQNEEDVIWTGILQWRELQNGANINDCSVLSEELLPKQIPCKISVSTANGRTKISWHGWPTKLVMQWIPKVTLGTLGGSYLARGVTSVGFTMENCDALNSFNKVINQGFVGCVYFIRPPLQLNGSNIKVLILAYSIHQGIYVGFIPNDQTGFVGRIREFIRKRRQRLQQQQTTDQAFPEHPIMVQPQQSSMLQEPQPMIPKDEAVQCLQTPISSPAQQYEIKSAVSLAPSLVTNVPPPEKQLERPGQSQLQTPNVLQAMDDPQSPETLVQLLVELCNNASLEKNLYMSDHDFNELLSLLKQYSANDTDIQQRLVQSQIHEQFENQQKSLPLKQEQQQTEVREQVQPQSKMMNLQTIGETLRANGPQGNAELPVLPQQQPGPQKLYLQMDI